jgi:hypothetical protein
MGLQQHRERRYGGGVYLREERSWFLSSFRAGFIVRNNSAQTPRIELCWGSLRIDARSC